MQIQIEMFDYPFVFKVYRSSVSRYYIYVIHNGTFATSYIEIGNVVWKLFVPGNSYKPPNVTWLASAAVKWLPRVAALMILVRDDSRLS